MYEATDEVRQRRWLLRLIHRLLRNRVNLNFPQFDYNHGIHDIKGFKLQHTRRLEKLKLLITEEHQGLPSPLPKYY